VHAARALEAARRELELVRAAEPDNLYDANAIAVWCKD
jgi:hypothetical protein